MTSGVPPAIRRDHATLTAQRNRSLRLANEVRIGRAQLIPKGTPRERMAQLLREPPPLVEDMRITAFLSRARGYGGRSGIKLHKLLRSLHITETRKVRSLTDRQREELAQRLDRR